MSAAVFGSEGSEAVAGWRRLGTVVEGKVLGFGD